MENESIKKVNEALNKVNLKFENYKELDNKYMGQLIDIKKNYKIYNFTILKSQKLDEIHLKKFVEITKQYMNMYMEMYPKN